MNEWIRRLATLCAGAGDDPVSQGVAGGTIHAAKLSQSLVPSHSLGTWLLGVVRDTLDILGIRHNRTVEEIVYTVVVLVLAWCAAWVLKTLAELAIQYVWGHRKNKRWSDALARRTIRRCSHVITPLFFMAMVPLAFTRDHAVLHWILRLSVIWLIVAVGIALCAVIYNVWDHYNRFQNVDHHPLRGVVDVARGLVWIIVVIVGVSVFIDRSPMALLAGLGAFAAALMLIFKDSIMGFVASIQLSTNDMVRVGDWIVVPDTPANGAVLDVTLTAVKVQNWDNTIITLPPYTLVSTSFQNWRNMYARGQRQVTRNLYLDANSVKKATPQLLQRLSQAYPCVKAFVAERQAARAKGEPEPYLGMGHPNGTIDTNLGLFRYYLSWYLLHHPQVDPTYYLLVSLNQDERFGLSLNVYFYSRQTAWVQYEAVLSQIWEHCHATAAAFGLRVYNTPDANAFTVDVTHEPQ